MKCLERKRDLKSFVLFVLQKSCLFHFKERNQIHEKAMNSGSFDSYISIRKSSNYKKLPDVDNLKVE